MVKKAIIFLVISLLTGQNLFSKNETYFSSINNMQTDFTPNLSMLTVTDQLYRTTRFDSTFSNKVNNIITLGINYDDPVFRQAYKLAVKLDVVYYLYNGSTYDSITDTGKILTVRYNPSRGATENDKDMLFYKGAYKIVITITAIWLDDVVQSSLPMGSKNVYINSEILIDRYYNFSNSHFSSLSDTILRKSIVYSATNDSQLTVSWGFCSGDEQYDLEWTFVDREAVGNTSVIPFDFRNNATRVTVTENSYNIPLIYESGYIFWRVRARGFSMSNFTKELTGKWSLPDTNTVSSYSKYYFNGFELEKNWQSAVTYAEEGKRKEVVSFFDGSFRNRQSLTIINTDNNAIVGQTIYDFTGRPAIQVLPVPSMDNHTLNYRESFNKNTLGNAYTYFDFDMDNDCDQTKTGKMSTSSGASRYYSPNNSNQSDENAYIPVAGGYPFTQTEYTPDNTGRIRRQSGAGSVHRLNGKDETGTVVSGKETRYYYATPAQEELLRLFGNEVGNFKHYKKNAVIDANGQASVSYLDHEGRTVATALAGDSALTPSLDALASSKNTFPLKIDLLDSSEVDSSYKEMKSVFTLLVTSSRTYYFDYSMEINAFADCPQNICYSCVYDLNIRITDECGRDKITELDTTIGHLSIADSNCGNKLRFSIPDQPLQLTLDPGTYTVSKTLTVNANSVDYYADVYMDTCTSLKKLNDFKGMADFSGCEINCGQCESSLNMYYSSHHDTARINDSTYGYMSFENYQERLAECRSYCEITTPCKVLYENIKDDMRPGGQYALYEYDTNTFLQVSTTDVNSFFYNVSPNYFAGRISGLNFSPSSVEIDGTIKNVTNLTPVEFVKNWRESWVDALVPLHPEYCFYNQCLVYDTIFKFQNLMHGTTKYSDAVFDSFYLPDYSTIAIKDPIGSVSSTLATQFQSELNNYENGYSIKQIVGQYMSQIGSDSSHPACTPDKSWEVWKSLYIARETKILSDAISASCTNSVNIPAGKKRRFYLNVYEGLTNNQIPINNSPTKSNLEDTARANLTRNCSQRCINYADLWLSKLDSCNLSNADKDTLRAELIRICTNGCNEFNPLGANSATIPTQRGNFTFRQAFDQIVGAENLHCNPFKIDYPLSQLHTYFGYRPMDSCTCFEIKNNQDLYHFMIEPNTLPPGVCSEEDLFENVYGYRIPLLQAKCFCKRLYPGEYSQYLNIPDTSVSCDVLNNIYPYQSSFRPLVPKELTCTSCINCTKIHLYLEAFKSEHPALITNPLNDSTFRLFTVYLNDKYNHNFSYTQVEQLYNNCQESINRFQNRSDSLIDFFNSLLSQNERFTFMNLTLNDFPDAFHIFDKPWVCSSLFMQTPPVNMDNALNAWSVPIQNIPSSCDYCTVSFYYPSPETPLNLSDLTSFDPSTITFISMKNWTFSVIANYGNVQKLVTVQYTNCTPPFPEDSLCYEPVISSIQDDCAKVADSLVLDNAVLLYRNYQDSVRNAFKERYIKHCMHAAESFNMQYNELEYHYTLYYYDQAGNLIKTVPPAGVVPLDTASVSSAKHYFKEPYNHSRVLPQHTLITNYKYNTLNKVVRQTTPDGGLTRFWYDILGRVAVSQNARQKPTNNFSYTLYDPLGRIIEVGELINADSNINDSLTANSQILQSWIRGAGPRSQVTRTYYDTTAFPDSLPMLQQNLRNRISAVTYLQTFDTIHMGSYNYATHYSYDIHGNVKELVQEIKNLPGSGQHFKKMEYDYDLVSGKVNEVRYQTGQKDEFRHSYEYDADNRIIQVNTSVNGIVWTKEAKYKYYAHGPLARTELGEYQVQGLDYAYTLQGWMKVMNSDNLNPLNDLGRDGNINPSGPNTSFARDAFGYVLGYYTDDFNSISGQTNFEISKTNSTFEDNSRNLYNGNIKQMTIGIMDVNGNRMPEMGTDFYYDQLNRLVRSHAYLGTNIYQQSSPSWQGVNPSDEYYTSYAYDPNGNITRLLRKGVATTLEMDDLKYSYTTGTNRLTRVEDGVSSGNYPNDIDNQVAGNYDYDQTGNLVKDSSAQMHISWNVYGKISQVRKTGSMTIDYEYDATGNRVMKRISGSGSTLSTYYIRDAQGNIMSVYQVSGGVLYLTEQHLYGSSRLGVKNVFIAMNGSGVDTSRFTDTLGMKQYELTNHLGNVQVVVSDRKIPVDDNNGSIAWFEADVLSAYDFFPFGMEMPGRVFNLSTVQGNNIYIPGNRNYPFGYQSSIKDNELCGDGNAYSTYFRELDVRLGRWFAIDPKTSATPWESPYVSMGDNPINLNDILGEKVGYANSDDKKRVKEAKKHNKDFRKDFRQLKRSSDLYVFSGTELTKDEETCEKGIGGETTFNENYNGNGTAIMLNYKYGNFPAYEGIGKLGSLIHETKHGVEFDNGEYGFIKQNGIWKPANFDNPDEYKAYNAEYQSSQMNEYLPAAEPNTCPGKMPTNSYSWRHGDKTARQWIVSDRTRNFFWINCVNDHEVKNSVNYFRAYNPKHNKSELFIIKKVDASIK